MHQLMNRIIQADTLHESKSIQWHCTRCKEEFCMYEEPKFCPMCGVKAEQIVCGNFDFTLPHIQR